MGRLLENFLFSAILLFAPSGLFALDFSVFVYDAASFSPAADVQIIIIESKQKFRTNEKGFLQASVPKSGVYTFRAITHSGAYKQLQFQILQEGQIVKIYVGDKKKDEADDEGGIVITGRKDKTKLSRYRVRMDEIKRIPGVFGEAIKGLETLPGITTPSGFSNGSLIIRGADARSNFYLLDDLPIGYAFHFLALNSVIHNDLIKSIDIYTGAFPAEYGDATGGIISIETIDEVERFGGHNSFSLWSANMLLKGTMFDKSGYWVAAARASYLDVTLGPSIPKGIDVPRYGDVQFKLNYRPDSKHSFYFYGLGAKDTFGIKVEKKVAWDPTTDPDPVYIGAEFSQDQAFTTTGVRHEYRPFSRLLNTLTILHHNNIFFVEAKLGEWEAKIKQEDGYYAVKDVLKMEMIEKHLFLDVGIELRNFVYKNTGKTIRQLDPNDPSPDPFDTQNPDYEMVPLNDRHYTSYNSGFLMLTIKGSGFEFKPGFRVDYFGLSRQRTIDPRGTFSYTLPSKTTFILGGGRFHRVPEPWQYSPTAGNENLKMERAEHYGVGIEQEIGNYTIKLEGYRHYFSDLVVTDPYITTPVRVNPDNYTLIQDPILYNDRLGYSNDGTGFSEGAEIYVKKAKPPGKNGWFGWVSGTWSRTLRNDHQHIPTEEEKNTIYSADERRVLMQYDNTKDELADFDRSYIVNFVYGYQFSKEWQFGARWKYSTSAPYTPIVGDDGGQQVNNGRIIFDPVFSNLKNSERLGPSHRLDIRIDRFLNYEWGFGNVFLELINVYVRKNPQGMGFNRAMPYSLSNPTTAYAFDYLQIPEGKGKSRRIPLFNFGIEMQF